MDRSHKQWIALALASIYINASAVVVCGGNDDFQSQLDELRSLLDEAEKTNETVRLELDEARSNQTNEWLSTQRVSAINSIVRELLADSDTRVNLQGGTAMMGWSDGFYLSSADGRFKLNVGGLFQNRFLARWLGDQPQGVTGYDEWRQGFEMTRTQLTFDGQAFGRGLDFFIKTGWGRSDPRGDPRATTDDQTFTFRLWDAWVKFRLTNEFGIKLGQFNLPFSRESLVKAQYQLAIERSSVDGRMGLGRSAGIEFDWANDNQRFMFSLSNGSGALWQSLTAFQSDFIVPPFAWAEMDTLYSGTMRYEWKLLGNWEQFQQFTSPPGSERGVLIGVAGHRQNAEINSPDPIGGFPDGLFWGVTGDLTMQFDGASLFASVIYERVTDYGGIIGMDANWLAYVVQGSTYLTNQLELYARYEAGGPDREQFGGDDLQLFTVGFNKYLDGQELKLSADIGISFGEVSGWMTIPQTGWATDSRRRDQVVLRTQLQLMF
jgi:hypothetical protein